jgi:hypothetical protein
MNTSQLQKLRDIQVAIPMGISEFIRTAPEHRIDSIFIQEVRKTANQILDWCNDMEMKR